MTTTSPPLRAPISALPIYGYNSRNYHFAMFLLFTRLLPEGNKLYIINYNSLEKKEKTFLTSLYLSGIFLVTNSSQKTFSEINPISPILF
jgi:hypothetical protein